MGSQRYSLNAEDGKRILIGAGVAIGGALLTYGSEVVTQIDFGSWTPVVVAIWSVIVNVGRKWIADHTV